MGTIKTTNIETITGSGTLTLGQSGETITIPSGVTITNNGTQTGFGGTNTPAFFAYRNGSIQLANATWNKVPLNAELFDTDNCFDSTTNYRFTPTTAGKYFFSAQLEISQIDQDGNIDLAIYKNGSIQFRTYYYASNPAGGGGGPISTPAITMVTSMNGSTDYVELYVRWGSGLRNVQNTETYNSFFQGYKIIE